MLYYDISRVDLAGGGTAFEITPAIRSKEGEFFHFTVEDGSGAVILTVSDPSLNTVGVPGDGRIFLIGPQQDQLYRFLTQSELVYVDATEGRTRFAVINDPSPGEWKLLLEDGSTPFQANLLVLPSQLSVSAGGVPPPKPRCRLCKITAKAIALSIVAAAGMATVPQAVILAVAKFLGAGSVVAAAFVTSVLGDTVDVIAEKLCKRIGLC